MKVKRNEKTASSLCHACLSIDRIVHPLGEFSDIFFKIGSICTPKYDIHLCWECMALLRKVKKFKLKVEEAQNVLQHHDFKKSIDPISLSTLVLGKIEYENVPLVIEEIIEDVKPEIKCEPESEYDDNDFLNNLDDYKFELDLKLEENNVEINGTNHTKSQKKRPQSRSLKYRLIVNENKTYCVKRIRILKEDLNKWLDMERNSSRYKNAVSKCEKCITKYDGTKINLEQHERKVHDPSLGQYSCSICQARLPTKESLSYHEDKHYYMYECEICGFQCYHYTNMRNHTLHHGKTVQCRQCSACFNNTRHFFTHYRNLHKVFECDHCGKICTAKSVMEKHMRYHTRWECRPCGRVFKTHRVYRDHVRIKHTLARTEAAFCVQCDVQFNNIHLYKRHIASSVAHVSERRVGVKKEKIPCPECGKQYMKKNTMMNHFRHVHMKASRFYCKICDRTFLNTTRYKEHIKFTHEGQVKVKDKMCNVCGRGFNTNRILTNHMRTHSGERPFVCTYCDAKFTQKQAMLSHIKFVHLKNKRK